MGVFSIVSARGALTSSSSARLIHGKPASAFTNRARQRPSGGFHFRTTTTATASAINIRTGSRAGVASSRPAPLRPTPRPSKPSLSEASGLLPAQAIAHTAITLASRSGPALVASTVRVAELAIRHAAPAPNAAKNEPHAHGERTNPIMHTDSAARAVAARRSEGVCKEGRTDPRTVPPPRAAMNHPDQLWLT